MPIEHDILQGDEGWLKLRIGKVTASELGNLLTPEFKQREGETPKTYLYSKVAEAWRGQPLPSFTSWATEQGELLEAEARKWFAFVTEHKIRNIGVVEAEGGRFGCSPDALLDADGGLELKAPQSTNHVRYLMEGILPKDYVTQVHGCLYATGRPWWKFVSYRRGFPSLVLKIERDEEICEKIAKAVERFSKSFDEAMQKLKDADQ